MSPPRSATRRQARRQDQSQTFEAPPRGYTIAEWILDEFGDDTPQNMVQACIRVMYAIALGSNEGDKATASRLLREALEDVLGLVTEAEA